MVDPVKAVLDHLRAASFVGDFDTFSDDPAIFRTEVPGHYKESFEPYTIVDPLIPLAGALESYTSDGGACSVPLRLFAKTQRRDDGLLSATAFAVRKLFHKQSFPIPGAVLINARAALPVDAPSGDRGISGRRVLIDILYEEA